MNPFCQIEYLSSDSDVGAGWIVSQLDLQERLYRLPPTLMRPSLKVSTVMPSGLEDRIHQLCAQAVAAKNEAELQFILPQLREAIRDHIRYCRALAVEVIPEAFGSDSNAAD
jgi:hypothetical protein